MATGPRWDRRLAGAVVACGISDAAANVVIQAGLHSSDDPSTLPVMSVLSALYPIGTIVLAGIMLRERLSVVQTIGIVLAVRRVRRPRTVPTTPATIPPASADRWTWLVIACHTQLRLSRPLARDLRRPWEKPALPGRLTPARVRRGFRNIRATLPCRCAKTRQTWSRPATRVEKPPSRRASRRRQAPQGDHGQEGNRLNLKLSLGRSGGLITKTCESRAGRPGRLSAQLTMVMI